MMSSVVAASTMPESNAVAHSAMPGCSINWVCLANFSLTLTADVVPVMEHSRLPFRSLGPSMPVSSLRTSRSCPATKYGPAKSTTFLRSSVME